MSNQKSNLAHHSTIDATGDCYVKHFKLLKRLESLIYNRRNSNNNKKKIVPSSLILS